MDDTFLNYYADELRHIREVAAEFGDAHPLVAGQLRLRADSCGDPFVERLLEGFAFLAARVHHKLDSDFPVLSQGLLETVYPSLLSPIPAMGIVELEPSDSLSEAVTVPRDTELTGLLGEGASTRCVFRTAHEVRIHPFKISKEAAEEIRFFDRDLGLLDLPRSRVVRGALRLTLDTESEDALFSEIEPVDFLDLFVTGAYSAAGRIYEEIMGQTCRVYVRPVGGKEEKCIELEPNVPGGVAIETFGFDENEALLPVDSRVFDGHRVLMEYSSLPERLLFVRLTGLEKALSQIESSKVEIIFGFGRSSFDLSKLVMPSSFVINATPVINLFEMRADQVSIEGVYGESHVVANRTKPLHYEVVGVKAIKGISSGQSARTVFEPFYRGASTAERVSGFYTVRREPRVLTHSERLNGSVSRYQGSEVFVSLVNSSGVEYHGDVEALSIRVLCSNRHLPLSMQLRGRDTDLIPEGGSGLASVRWLVPPTSPQDGLVNTTGAWRLLSQLSLNYLSLIDNDDGEGATALRNLLRIYLSNDGEGKEQWVQGVTNIQSKAVVERAITPGPIAFQRGIEVEVHLDEDRFAGGSAFVFGAVLARFLSDHISINSFLKTKVVSESRGSLITWPGRAGSRPSL